ncbi:hypothetical protein HPG69_003392 [Diceros bicornis minor]|uniref:Uncharacterized protein n=1 Tax=Diceros bicornis minor TaxID=77932 RepID=A0A7J7E8Q7_DICBM|nr:hypothetical protein HPG69_003392 [Diceros bicornis minor]
MRSSIEEKFQFKKDCKGKQKNKNVPRNRIAYMKVLKNLTVKKRIFPGVQETIAMQICYQKRAWEAEKEGEH